MWQSSLSLVASRRTLLRQCRSTIITTRMRHSSSVVVPPTSPQHHHHHHHCNHYNHHHLHHNPLQQRRYKSVFVSKHNQSLNVTVKDILDVMNLGGTTPGSSSHNSSSSLPYNSNNNYNNNYTYRTTAQHVIFQECPFCSKPTQNKTDNQYKLYVKIGGGAYFCHRCGTGGSWFDFKARLNGGTNISNHHHDHDHHHHTTTTNSIEDITNGQATTQGATTAATTTTIESASQALRRSSRNNNNITTTATNTTKSRSNNSNSHKKTTGFHHFLQQQPSTQHNIPCLPMPSPRLQALYSSQLLDQQQQQQQPQQSQQSQPPPQPQLHTNNNNNNSSSSNSSNNNNKALQYLLQERGLTIQTLRRYGVGCAQYSFPLPPNQQQHQQYQHHHQHQQYQRQQTMWKTVECITFPWIMTVEDVQYQEELRGASFVYPTLATAAASSTASTATASNTTATITSQKKKKGTKNSKEEQEDDKINKGGDDDDDDDDDDNNNSISQKDDDTNSNNSTSTGTSSSSSSGGSSSSRTFLTRRIKARALENKAWQRLDPAGGGWGLFGYHTIPVGAKEVIVTEGEYDAMAVWQATGRAAVSLPNGCRSLPVEVLPLLEEFDKIYLWMDNDAPGQEGAELFAKKIGLERCFLVRPTTQNTGLSHEQDLPKDANDALRQGLDLNAILDDAKVVPHEQILKFQDLRSDVLHEIMYPEKYVGLPIPSLPKFTSVIKGLRRGELTVLTGPTGSGKTTFLGQMSLDLAEQDINVLWGSFEIKNTRLMHKLLQQFAREPLPTGDPSAADKLMNIADRFEELPLNFLRFHGGSDVDEVLDAMDYAVYVNDTQHVILDNMQFMISRQQSNSTWDKFDIQDIAIEKFRKFATDRNIHITLVMHPKKQEEDSKLSISSFYGSAKATQEADTVIILQSENGKKYLDIRKNRFNGELGQTELFFDRKSCRYTEVPNFNSKPKTTAAVPTIAKPTAMTKPKEPVAENDHWDKFFQ